MKQLLGYLYAKKGHAKTDDDRAMYAELTETAKEFPESVGAIRSLMLEVGA